jgi:hypothetical protein
MVISTPLYSLMAPSVLELLPGNILRTVRQWEKETGAAIYVMSAWIHPEEGPKGYEYVHAFIERSPQFSNHAAVHPSRVVATSRVNVQSVYAVSGMTG